MGIIVDDSPNTTVVRSVNIDGLSCDHWQHVRRTSDGEVFGTMNWFVNAVDDHPDLVKTAFVSSDGLSVGSRDFHRNYTRSVPTDVAFDENTYLTKDVKCEEQSVSGPAIWGMASAFGWDVPIVAP